jgi:hypothetical protein
MSNKGTGSRGSKRKASEAESEGRGAEATDATSKKLKSAFAEEIERDADEDSAAARLQGRHVIVIIDGAQLETVKTKKGDFQLLNCDDHVNLMRKLKKDPQLFRPDIVHQVMKDLFYSAGYHLLI